MSTTNYSRATGKDDVNRDGVMVPFWAYLISTMMYVGIGAGTLYWSFVVVSSSYNVGFQDGWSRGQTSVPVKFVNERIIPQSTHTKSHQPGG